MRSSWAPPSLPLLVYSKRFVVGNISPWKVHLQDIEIETFFSARCDAHTLQPPSTHHSISLKSCSRGKSLLHMTLLWRVHSWRPPESTKVAHLLLWYRCWQIKVVKRILTGDACCLGSTFWALRHTSHKPMCVNDLYSYKVCVEIICIWWSMCTCTNNILKKGTVWIKSQNNRNEWWGHTKRLWEKRCSCQHLQSHTNPV